jgi:hypothetical protein
VTGAMTGDAPVTIVGREKQDIVMVEAG